MNVTAELETIFAQAVSLSQSGRMVSTIYAGDREVFIFNGDKTMLFHFDLPPHSPVISPPIAFSANDYDSNSLRTEGDRVIFSRQTAEFVREKVVAKPEKTVQQIRELYTGFMTKPVPASLTFSFPASFLSLLEEGLSHVEFVIKDSVLTVLQRDIYSGALIKITKKEDGGLLFGGVGIDPGVNPVSIPTIGIRTTDFISLFSFQKEIQLRFPAEGHWVLGMGEMWGMRVLIGSCLYDSIGTTNILYDNTSLVGKEKA